MPIGLLGITLLSLIAASAHDDAPRQARAHTHGAGEAFILLEGSDLFIQIAAPAANFRTPEGALLSVADLSGYDMTEDFLSLPARAQCTVQSQQVEQEGYEGEDAVEHGHSHDASHAHDDGHHTEGGHDHEQHGDHHHEGEHADHHENHAEAATPVEHANFLVTFEAECERPDRLSSVNFAVFEALPGFETLQTTFMTDGGADATTLSASNPTMSRP
ncbi:DUF2796 domain-containing protein [Ponticaulis sp.]|uniref:ZrgA family zinc uptake protein n=1 Tax=Ponticaulis sp. TaxID=2020902 RepID=UPI002610FAD1|nr:DUF2796 domain-containing protein [Ponticaulis sp.]MDF1678948.1 DUF2796 domain-containing protein [Ponticaulis sp.]